MRARSALSMPRDRNVKPSGPWRATSAAGSGSGSGAAAGLDDAVVLAVASVGLRVVSGGAMVGAALGDPAGALLAVALTVAAVAVVAADRGAGVVVVLTSLMVGDGGATGPARSPSLRPAQAAKTASVASTIAADSTDVGVRFVAFTGPGEGGVQCWGTSTKSCSSQKMGWPSCTSALKVRSWTSPGDRSSTGSQ